MTSQKSFFKRNPYLGAIGLGLVGAIISSLIWFGFVVLTGWQFGIIAILVGILIGKGVLIGSGNKGGRDFQIISVILTAGAMLLSEYFIGWYVTYQYLLEQGIGVLNFFLPPSIMFKMVQDSIGASPSTLLFFGIAIWQAAVIPKLVKKE